MNQQTGLPVNPTQGKALQALYAPRLTKLAVMSMTTLGFYLVYWGYKNWKIMKASGRTLAWAPLCAFFLPFTLFSLLDKIEGEAEAVGVSRSKLTASAFGFLLINIFRLVPIIGILGNLINFLALIPINRTFTKINAFNQQTKPEYENFTVLNKAWLIFVIAWLAFHIIREMAGVP